MKNLRFTLMAWPVITLVVIGLCALTDFVAKAYGIALPEQTQLKFVRELAGWNWKFAIVLAQVVVVAPLLEEFVFRYLLVRLPIRLLRLGGFGSFVTVTLGSAVFSAAHYLDFIALVKSHALVWTPLSDAFVALFFFGLAQCWLYAQTRRLVYPILNHALFNGANLALLFALEALK